MDTQDSEPSLESSGRGSSSSPIPHILDISLIPHDTPTTPDNFHSLVHFDVENRLKGLSLIGLPHPKGSLPPVGSATHFDGDASDTGVEGTTDPHTPPSQATTMDEGQQHTWDEGTNRTNRVRDTRGVSPTFQLARLNLESGTPPPCSPFQDSSSGEYLSTDQSSDLLLANLPTRPSVGTTLTDSGWTLNHTYPGKGDYPAVLGARKPPSPPLLPPSLEGVRGVYPTTLTGDHPTTTSKMNPLQPPGTNIEVHPLGRTGLLKFKLKSNPDFSLNSNRDLKLDSKEQAKEVQTQTDPSTQDPGGPKQAIHVHIQTDTHAPGSGTPTHWGVQTVTPHLRPSTNRGVQVDTLSLRTSTDQGNQTDTLQVKTYNHQGIQTNPSFIDKATIRALTNRGVQVDTLSFRTSTNRGVQTDALRVKTFNHQGIQTNPSSTDEASIRLPPPSRTPLFQSQEGANLGSAPAMTRALPRVNITTLSEGRFVSFPQEDDQESLATTNSVDTLLGQVKTLMCEAAKFEVRARHVEELNERDLLAPWATTVQPYPPFIQSNSRLLTKIREVRREAATRVQELAHADFDRQAARLQTEGETLILTIDGLMKGQTSASIDARLEHVASLVGQTKAELTTQLYDRRQFLARRQPTSQDWDNFFKYNVAYRKYKINQAQEFEVSPRDRRQAEKEDKEEVRNNLRDDVGHGNHASTAAAPPPPQSHHKKRKRDQSAAGAPGTYRIPRKAGQHQPDRFHNQGRREPNGHRQGRGRRPHRDASPGPTPRRNQDFPDSRPLTPHKTTYYRSGHDGRRGRDDRQGRDPSRTRTHTHQRHDRDEEERNRQLHELQQQLDRLRRQ